MYLLIISPSTALLIKDFEMNDWVGWKGDLQLRAIFPGPPRKSRVVICGQPQGMVFITSEALFRWNTGWAMGWKRELEHTDSLSHTHTHTLTHTHTHTHTHSHLSDTLLLELNFIEI